jgi:hypothetical protein
LNKLPPSVFTYSHDSWQKLVKFYESAIANDVVLPEPVEPEPVVEEVEEQPEIEEGE